MAAFLAMRAGTRGAAEAAIARAYAVGAQVRERDRRLRAIDPAAVTVPGGDPLRDTRGHAVAGAGLFDRFVEQCRGAAPTSLVGNAPSILSQGHGAAIDAGGPVVRLNDFRIAGFAADVGTRTDYWISSAARMAEPDAASIGAATAILVPPHPVERPDVIAFAERRLGLTLAPERAGFLPPWVRMLGDALLYPAPSTGMRAILLLEFLVGAPYRAFGFDFFQGSAMHYFDRGASRHLPGESHAIGFERDFVMEVLVPLARFGRF